MSGRVPLSKMAQKKRAAKLYEDFTGHDAQEIGSVRVPALPDVVCVIGEVEAIQYNTTRDGQFERYKHDFKKSARPVLAVAPDGTQLLLLGGSYDFTERGIVDRG